MLKPAILVLIIVTVGCVLLFVGSFVVGIPFHNYRLDQNDKAFYRVKHPPTTSIVKSKKQVSTANANDCGYFVGELRRYSGSKSEIETFYANQPNNGIRLLFVENGKFPTDAKWRLPYGSGEISDWQLPPSDIQNSLYLVYLFETGDGFFDIRCH